MAITVRFSTAGINVVAQKAKPAIDFTPPKVVVANLTNGYQNVNTVSNTFSAVGQVEVTVGPGDNMSLLAFGFIQIQKVKAAQFFYAGKRVDHGAVSLFVDRKPAMPQTVALDSSTFSFPWTKGAPRFTHQPPKVVADTGDHPLTKAPKSITNSVTLEQNLLFHLIDDREFWTVFMSEDSSGVRTPMAHFHWSLRYDFMLIWPKGNPTVHLNRSTFKVDATVSGPPTDAAIAALVTAPNEPHSNDLMKAAVFAAVSRGQSVNRKDHERRFANVPPTFFTP
ncbi:MAG: hypothetical protein GEU99_02975 [Luteitalea sp.]|nr:hypothetical protein [Luteitalea sp.]